MLESSFKKWRHLHKFYNIDGKQTEVVDEIQFQLPYGIFGKLFEGYAYSWRHYLTSRIQTTLTGELARITQRAKRYTLL